MSITTKLTLLTAGLVLGLMGLLIVSTYSLPRSVLRAIDSELQELAQTTLQSVDAADIQTLGELRLPDTVSAVDRATTLLVTANAYGLVINASDNLGAEPKLLDRAAVRLADATPESVLSTRGQLRILTVPITVDDGGTERLLGYLQIGRQVNEYDTYRDITLIAGLVGVAILSATLIAIIRYVPRFLEPLGAVTLASEQITTASDLQRRIPYDGKRDEIGRLARSFNQLMERMEQLFNTQQRLLADVSHELRTPLTSMRGHLDLIRIVGSDAASLDAIEAELMRMTRLVEDILTLARADGGGLQLRVTSVDLDTILLDAYRQVMMLRRPVKLVIDEIDQVQVQGDADRLKQLIIILAENATKYTPEGGRVSLGLKKDERYAYLTVSDTGIGIPAEHLPYIFERFYRVEKARTRPGGGSGLGLSIARWIAEAHEGAISVTSVPGEGSEFVVKLPLRTASGNRVSIFSGRLPAKNGGAAAATSPIRSKEPDPAPPT